MGLHRLLLLSIILLLGVCLFQYSRIQGQQKEYEQISSIIQAVQDSLHIYKDKYGRVVSEKGVIQADMKTLEASYKLLSSNQRALVQDIKHLTRKEQKGLQAASSIIQEAKVIHHTNVASAAGKDHSWSLVTDTLHYSIRVAADTLKIDTLIIPNRLILTQHKDSKGNIHVTARNTNPIIRNKELDTIIPPSKKHNTLGKILILISGIVFGILITR